jgi:hypothetical protein
LAVSIINLAHGLYSKGQKTVSLKLTTQSIQTEHPTVLKETGWLVRMRAPLRQWDRPRRWQRVVPTADHHEQRKPALLPQGY